MTIDTVLTALTTLAPLVPVPAVSIIVPILVQLARDLEAHGGLDTSAPVQLETLGDAHREALGALVDELSHTARRGA